MRRRDLLLASSALLAAPLAGAQAPARTFRIGMLFPVSAQSASAHLPAFRERMAQHGFVEGRNLTLDFRYPQVGTQLAAAAAKELMDLMPDVLVACTTTVTLGALAATGAVPIVFAWVADPISSGIVKAYARPGGRATGVTNRFYELSTKRLELLREALPNARRVAMLALYFDAALEKYLEAAQGPAKKLGLELVRRQASLGGWPEALKASMSQGADAAMVLTSFGIFGLHRDADETTRAARDLRLPTIYGDAETVERGGLMSYATSPSEDLRRAADLVAKILRGAKPAEIPVDQASRFELVVNRGTAQAMGLPLPQSVLLRADRVIE
jgi:putative ABC transport system substrate-binding protein